mgnify:CR=1 FL=1
MGLGTVKLQIHTPSRRDYSKSLVFDRQSKSQFRNLHYRFTVWAVMDGEKFPEVESTSKKQGNVQAADRTIEVLMERGEHVLPRSIRGQVQQVHLKLVLAVIIAEIQIYCLSLKVDFRLKSNI